MTLKPTTKFCKICFKEIKTDDMSRILDKDICICSDCENELDPKFIKFNADGYKAVSIYEYTPFIKNLICKVKPANNNENNALYFWQKIIKMNIFDEYEDSIFVRNSICMANNKIDDLKKLKYYLKHNKFNFHNIDISGEISVDRKYDYLILSNIAEWLSSSDYNNIWQFCRNVDQLLKDDGIAICSKLWNDDNDKRVKDILKRLFSINNLNDSTNYLPGYYLVKK